MTQATQKQFLDMYFKSLGPENVRLDTDGALIVLTIIELMRAEAERIWRDMVERANKAKSEAMFANAKYYSHAIAYFDHAKGRGCSNFNVHAVLSAAEEAISILKKDKRHEHVFATDIEPSGSGVNGSEGYTKATGGNNKSSSKKRRLSRNNR